MQLAAAVGGIGANRDEPGRFFFDNLNMGALLAERARLFGVGKFMGIGFRDEVRWDASKPDTQPGRLLDSTRAGSDSASAPRPPSRLGAARLSSGI